MADTSQNDERVTRLSSRDFARFLKALNTVDAKPNLALQEAARRYRMQCDGRGKS